MTNQQHPITPPPELVQQWITQIYGPENGRLKVRDIEIAARSSQWGWYQREPEIQAAANQELVACCEWISTIAGKKWSITTDLANSLYAARRPEPSSLKEQALAILDDAELDSAHYNILLRALEALPDD
jgi:hypothetical protein